MSNARFYNGNARIHPANARFYNGNARVHP
jgi:hypothetical protein